MRLVADRRHRSDGVPRAQVAAAGAGGVCPDLDNHFWRAGDGELTRGLNALTPDVGEDVGPASGFEHVVKETDGAARIDASKRFGVAAEHKQRAGARPPRDTLSDVGDVRLDAIGEVGALPGAPDPPSQLANRLRDVGKTGMLIRERSESLPAPSERAVRFAFRKR